ncbi:MAG: 50S ribosomal protein L25/general stress protein Ctc [Gammaproteobacteria bacterium]|nr:50S ribosomal protein L25/general stress protein Ctc [Gammaproteobacteria bacterium]MDH5777155.1 50S ribosomal protein L25/general stress protein Ctc [Gammaproteobacteria bacterium]
MSGESYVLEAEARNDLGKGASRRLRRTGKVPAILYGAGKEPTSFCVDQNDLLHKLENEAFFSHILTVKLDGKEENAIIKDLQRHPSRPVVMHMDLQRVNMSEKIRVHVPLHFMNEDQAPGVREGGLVTHNATETEVSCLPKDLPEFLEVDLIELDLDGIVHLSDIKLPAGVEIVELSHGEGHDQPIASIHMPRAAKEESAADASAEGGEEAKSGEEGNSES